MRPSPTNIHKDRERKREDYAQKFGLLSVLSNMIPFILEPQLKSWIDIMQIIDHK